MCRQVASSTHSRVKALVVEIDPAFFDYAGMPSHALCISPSSPWQSTHAHSLTTFMKVLKQQLACMSLVMQACTLVAVLMPPQP